jgi:murein DD-endopeptidase MepM/ murein hydrolase activator NlpD
MAGLALPTAAAVALMFTATGAAMATSPKTQSVTFSQNATAVTTAQPSPVNPAAHPAPVDPAVIRAQRAKAIQHTLAVVRADVAAKANRSALVAAGVARSNQRKALAARAQQAQQAQQAQAHGWRLPVKNYVLTSGFGFRWGRLHAGEDFAVPIGTDLAAMSTGTVDFAGPESGFGNLVRVRYWDGTISYFGHMSSISVNVGESVAAGQVVGQSGNTGHSTGPHLHLEIHPNGGQAVDPLPWLAAHGIAP